MNKHLPTILLLFVFCSIVSGDPNNLNAWHPDASIPNVYLTELYTFHGLPKNTDSNRDIKVLVNHGYAIGYSEDLKVPLYAVYRYGNLQESAENWNERSFERPPKFQIDLRTQARIHTNDYTSSGYDRGHLAPNYGIRTQYGHLCQIETFLMSNIVPQKPSLNRYTWRYAEEKIAKVLAQDDRDPADDDDDICDLWVASGPIFEGQIQTFSDKYIAIPTGFFKIIVRQRSYWDSSIEAIALYYPQEPATDADKEQFVTVDWVETKTNLDFHCNLTDKIEDKVEKNKRGWDWAEVP